MKILILEIEKKSGEIVESLFVDVVVTIENYVLKKNQLKHLLPLDSIYSQKLKIINVHVFVSHLLIGAYVCFLFLTFLF